MFLSEQIRAFIVRIFFENAKSAGTRYLSVKQVVNSLNGNFICLVAASLKLALDAVSVKKTSYSQDLHRGSFS